MNIALLKTSPDGTPRNSFTAAHNRLPGTPAVQDARLHALAEFERLGLPHRRIEEWKYTDLRAAMRDVAPLASAPDQDAFSNAAKAVAAHGIAGTRRLVLVDGVFAPQLSDVSDIETGVEIRALRDGLTDIAFDLDRLLATTGAADAMQSLNMALMTDGVIVTVAAGVEISRPIQIIHIAIASSRAAFTRSMFDLGHAAKATLIETFVAADGVASYQAHDAVVVSVGDGARLEHLRFMDDAPDAINISNAFVTLGSNATLNAFGLTSGGAISRYQVLVRFAGEGSTLHTNGVNLLANRQHGDTTMIIDHAVPHCASREVFRAVLGERARSVFQGRIIVRPGAQKTDGKMMTRALLLSDEAEVDNKPELEIFADDVTCGHGATVGALDESLLFYLRARGLTQTQAEALLIQAFVGEAIESIVSDDLREFAIASAERWLAARA